MKRLHVNVGVADIEQSVRFYSTLFAAEPTVLERDYAKWMLDDPRVNFAITTREGGVGVSHLGIEAENESELGEVFGRVAATGGHSLDEGTTNCCYARSTKRWVQDPQGVHWEAFLTHARTAAFGHSPDWQAPPRAAASCCG